MKLGSYVRDEAMVRLLHSLFGIGILYESRRLLLNFDLHMTDTLIGITMNAMPEPFSLWNTWVKNNLASQIDG